MVSARGAMSTQMLEKIVGRARLLCMFDMLQSLEYVQQRAFGNGRQSASKTQLVGAARLEGLRCGGHRLLHRCVSAIELLLMESLSVLHLFHQSVIQSNKVVVHDVLCDRPLSKLSCMRTNAWLRSAAM